MNKENENIFCPLPWVHLSLEPNGSVYSCCNTFNQKPLGNINKNSFEEILNNQDNQKIQDIFKCGKFPKQCEICKNEESLGQLSLRELSLKKYSSIHIESKPELIDLSLRLSNQCNLKCRICNPKLSTAWYQDARKIGMDTPDKVIKPFEKMNDFKSFLDQFPESVKSLYFAGGEPFLIAEFYQVLKKLIEMGKTDIELIINTNFSRLSFQKQNALELLSHFDTVYLDLSLDGVGKNLEYSRSGISWDMVTENIEKVRREYPAIKLKLFPTISIFNINHIDVFLLKYLSLEFKASDIKINPLIEPKYYCINILPETSKAKIQVKLKNLKKDIFKLTPPDENLLLIKEIQGLESLLMQNVEDKKLLEVGIQEIEKVDAIRNEKFEPLRFLKLL